MPVLAICQHSLRCRACSHTHHERTKFSWSEVKSRKSQKYCATKIWSYTVIYRILFSSRQGRGIIFKYVQCASNISPVPQATSCRDSLSFTSRTFLTLTLLSTQSALILSLEHWNRAPLRHVVTIHQVAIANSQGHQHNFLNLFLWYDISKRACKWGRQAQWHIQGGAQGAGAPP